VGVVALDGRRIASGVLSPKRTAAPRPSTTPRGRPGTEGMPEATPGCRCTGIKQKPPRPLRNLGGYRVGATGFGPATTCTPKGKRCRPGVSSDVQQGVTARPPERAGVQSVHPVPTEARTFAAALLLAPDHQYTAAEVAAVLRVSKATVYKLCDSGLLGCVRVVNVIRIPATALRRFMECAPTPKRNTHGPGGQGLGAARGRTTPRGGRT
jgi:excisionase family DNA binding protein